MTTRPGEAPVHSLPTTWERLDDRFTAVDGDSLTVRIASGCRWTEGGVYCPPPAASSGATSPTTGCSAGTS